MPVYSFTCNAEKGGCGHVYEEEMSMDKISKYKAVCPQCKKKKSYINYTTNIIPPSKTLGMLADKNSDKMSEDYKSHLLDKNNEYKKKKFTGKLPKGAKLMKDNE